MKHFDTQKSMRLWYEDRKQRSQQLLPAKYLLSVILLLFLSSSVAIAQEGEKVNEQDSLALVAYYHSTNGDQWVDNSGWLTGPVFSWVGIEEVADVSGDGEPADWRVTVIDMPRNNMTVPGPIPPEIEDLEFLEDFKADVNLQSGQLPIEIANLSRLQFLLVRNNLFTGSVDWNAFGSMPVMEQFRIRANFFSGDLPAVLGSGSQWSALRRFYVDDNRFTGQIPNVDATLTTLNRVYFQNNRLTGPIPDWSHLTQMEYYRIAGNDLEPGPIPQWIFDSWSETLIRFQIHNTNRTGSIPQDIVFMDALEQFVIGGPGDTIGDGETTADIPDMSLMPSLRRISLYGGGWTGPIPEWIGQLETLEDVHLQQMQISGPIPANLANSANINSIHIERTNVEGGIPAAWSIAQGLAEITLVDNPNMTVGQIPEWIGNNLGSLDVLRLANVGVTGTITSNLVNLPLEILNLRDNPELSGDLPSWIGTKNYREFEISRTGLNVSSIPDWVSEKNNLQYLGMAGLGLTGEIPTYFGSGLIAVNLRTLALNDNALTGGIPAELGDVLRLDSLNLANNNLSGEVPVELANAGRITSDLSLLGALLLSGNENLTGQLPLEFTDANFMRVLEFDGTDLCEPDDASFDAWIAGIPDFAAESYPTAYYSIKRTDVSCSDVSTEHELQPFTFELKQNYPNPFNPTTKIAYQLPDAGEVSLNVYNMLGQKVASLVEGFKSAGSYSVEFEANGLASGSYIYQLKAGNRVQTQKMLLIK